MNKKHKPIKFECEISLQKVPFLDTMLYKDQDNNSQKTIYRKPADQESYIHAKSEHHRKDVRNAKAIPAGIHFRKEGHKFIQHSKFTLL